MPLVIKKLSMTPTSRRHIEIVERKGLGHPDTICDGIAEEIARNITRYYLEETGLPLHFNLDKAVLVAGQAAPKFGGGRIIDPIELYVVGRATLEFRVKDDIKKTPIGSIVVNSVNNYIKRNFRFLDPLKHMLIDYRVRPGSRELIDIYEKWVKETKMPSANDTSIGVGFAPLTPTEKICKCIEKYLNDPLTKKEMPAIGEDIKVMCIRKNEDIKAIVAMAVVDSQVTSAEEYLELKKKVKEALEKKFGKTGDYNLSVEVNVADDPERNSFYLTVTGTSAESADDGQIGRGNRVNGLITPMRPMSIEAPAGKNAVSHVGKIYQIIAQRIAEKIVNEIAEVQEVYVYLVSKIAAPINNPLLADVEYIAKEKIDEKDIEGIFEGEMSKIDKIWREFMEGRISTY